MGINIGGIDITNSVLNSELRIAILEKTVQLLIERSTETPITQTEIDLIREAAKQDLIKKYPDAGIQKK